MTRRELSQYYWINREIKADEERLAALDAKATSPQSPSLTGMPHASGSQDRIGNMVAEIADLKTLIDEKRAKNVALRSRIEEFIISIDDSMTRQVFTYRCIDGMAWRDVANAMGPYMSEDNAKQIFHRYLKNQESL